MNRYRISKYNPLYRCAGRYLKDEWTDFSDIGKIFEGNVLTEQEYLSVEQNYISCLVDILRLADVDVLSITALECYEDVPWKNQQRVSIEIMPELFQNCLRNKCWCKLEEQKAYIHFGYDYYVYIGSVLSCDLIEKMCKKYSLFCNKQESPYEENSTD